MNTDQAIRLPESPGERAVVARAWAEVDAAERLGPAAYARAFGSKLSTENDRADEWFDPLEHAINRAAYESATNRVRFKRTCDFLTEGERVYEVGIGKGYLATMMMRSGRLGGYRGVDLVESNVRDTAEVLEENGFGDRADVGVQDLYDLKREDVEKADASLLVCCEVIEHVPDPEAALKVLADALPEGADLLWSVPLLGRLESVWGHTALFGAGRLQQMLAAAGLVAHHVEVLANTWVFMLASHSAAPSPRAEAAARAIAEIAPGELLEAPGRAITNVEPASLPRVESTWVRRTRVTDVPPAEHLTRNRSGVLSIEATPMPAQPSTPRAPQPDLAQPTQTEPAQTQPEGPKSQYAGVAFACPPGIRGVRIELDLSDPDRVSRCYVDFSKADKQTGRWTWRVDEQRPNTPQPTFVIRPGLSGQYLRKERTSATAEGADKVQVFIRFSGEEPVRLSVLRWAWVF